MPFELHTLILILHRRRRPSGKNMDQHHIERVLHTERKTSFPVADSLDSLLYLFGVVVAGLYQLWKLKRDVEGDQRRNRTLEEAREERTGYWDRNADVYSIPI